MIRAAQVPALLALLLAHTASAEDRVAAARKAKSASIAEMFKAANVAYPPGEVYLRAFKVDKQLELWAGPKGKPLALIKTFPICASSGTLGPKREEGDLQVPEGFYKVNRFNPTSTFHLALGIDYPNASDRILGHPGKLGGDIMIHGSCVTIGCIPLEDDPIEELYLIALDAKERGIRVDIFPGRLDDAAGFPALIANAGANAHLLPFWRSLQPAFLSFEKTHRPARFRIDPKSGEYQVDKGG